MRRVAVPEEFDLALPAGRLRARRFGGPSERTVLCLPGISSNSRAFDFIIEHLRDDCGTLVALDLRGRGYSEVTPAGTYGWLNHAKDVIDAATALGVRSVDVIGHSMGAYVALQAAQLAPERIRRLVLIDGLGIPRYAAFRAILRGIERLEGSYDTPEHYIGTVRALGFVVPWSEYWERVFRYDLVTVDGRVCSRTSTRAVFEDVAYGASHDPRKLWNGAQIPILVLRAAQPMVGRDGFVLTEFDAERFVRVDAARVKTEIDANHFGIMTHPQTAEAIRSFLG